MTLREIQTMFKQSASGLGEYELLSKTELANGYCDAEEQNNKVKKDQYWSALMLRYWYKIYEWIENSSSLHLDPEEFVGWLNDALYVAFYYKTWRQEFKKDGSVNPYYWRLDNNAPDKIINRCIFSQRGKVYQYYNKDKRKTNVITMSIDKEVNDNGDCALDFMNCTSDEIELDGTKDLIKLFLKKDKGIEALIIDGIVNGDSFKVASKKGNVEDVDYDQTSSYNFDMRRLIKHLTNLDEKYIKTVFCPIYNLSKEEGISLFEELKTINNKKLYKYINKTLIELRDDPKLLSCLI